MDLPKLSNPLRQDPKKVHGPAYRRGSLVSQVEPVPVRLRPYRPEKSLVPREVRANIFQETGGRSEAPERFVAHTKPLTAPEHKSESAIARSTRGTMEAISGDKLMGPLEAKASKFDGQSVSSTLGGVPKRRSGIARAGAAH